MPSSPTPAPAPATTTSNPMAGHVKAVAIIDLVLGALSVVVALGIIFAFGVGATAVNANEQYGAPGWVADMLASMAFIFGAIALGVAALYIVAGARLLGLHRSGKGLGIGAAIVQIILSLPLVFGAGLGLIGLGAGIYGLIILNRKETDALLVNP